MRANNIQQKRLQKELEMLSDNKIAGTVVFPASENLREWIALIKGPDETPYSEGTFEINISVPDNYPYYPPTLTFNTRIFHPNISADGKICVDILRNKWAPSLTIPKVLMSILSLLSSPNPDDPLVPEIARMFTENRKEFDDIARKYTKQFAIRADKKDFL